MNRSASLPNRFGRLGLVVNAWPRLFIALAIAAAIFASTATLRVPPLIGLLVGWDGGVVFFLASALLMAWGAKASDIRGRAARQDVGRTVIVTLTAAAAVASVGAIYAELTLGRGHTAWSVALAAMTFLLSWLFVHVFFAFHYAHQFYGRGEQSGGLLFPGGLEEPDYWDFFYFAVVIGMTSQVSDVAITDRRIRRTAAAHGMVAFFFNVALLAVAVSIAADAIKSG